MSRRVLQKDYNVRALHSPWHLGPHQESMADIRYCERFFAVAHFFVGMDRFGVKRTTSATGALSERTPSSRAFFGLLSVVSGWPSAEISIRQSPIRVRLTADAECLYFMVAKIDEDRCPRSLNGL
jgi:hypothetical protein